MKKSIKTKWIKALNSGKYRQGRDVLKNLPGEYCCLGVLCDLYLKENKKRWEKKESHGCYAIGFDDVLLPTVIKNWAGLDTEDPFIENAAGDRTRLSVLNDRGVPFKTIAKLIKEQY